jgi:hypothetical protein
VLDGLGFCSFLFSLYHLGNLVSGLIMVPFPIISRIILIPMDSVSVLSGTIISLEICLAPLIGKESDEFTVFDKSFDQNPQEDARLGPMAGGIMECVVLVCK